MQQYHNEFKFMGMQIRFVIIYLVINKVVCL